MKNEHGCANTTDGGRMRVCCASIVVLSGRAVATADQQLVTCH